MAKLMAKFRLRIVFAFVFCAALLLVTAAPASFAKKKEGQPVTRWTEGNPGCTFSRANDGRYYYAIWTDDVGITIGVDSQELQRHDRLLPLFGVFVIAKYRGSGSVIVRTDQMSLEFLTHSHVLHSSLDPNGAAARLQADTETLQDEAARNIKKHPEKKEEEEAKLQQYLKGQAELQEFIQTKSLNTEKLGPDKREVSGWVFFSARDKWIGSWRQQEQFLLRVPLQDRVFEFPFTLPPKEGDFILRKRPDNN
jgi:hypothetical protein